MINVDYTDDLAESLPHSLEQAGGIGVYENTKRKQFMFFKQEEAISSLTGKPLKFVGKFTNLGNNITSTESNINIFIKKACIAIYRLSIIWKSDLFLIR